jgi:hypothetical protein
MAIASPHSTDLETGHRIGSFVLGLVLTAVTGAILAFGAFVTMFAVAVCESSTCL